jgi:hypothetical protein
MLAHRRLDRAAQVARHLADAGCPVALHADARTPEGEVTAGLASVRDHPRVILTPRQPTPWGGWGLVAATEAAAAQLLQAHPEVGHVALVSGACLPIRPVEELRAFLAARPGVDFIESVTVADVRWAQGGLDAERFTLRFPFDWQRQRALFDLSVKVQRRLGLLRRLPAGVVPHLGSQWWCLTRPTLAAILAHPRRQELAQFFRHTWIPDEGWFQTMVRLVGARVDSRSLTFTRFDVKGRPRVFYDDHLQFLRATDCFLARKIWPGAEGLYRHLLAPSFPMPREGDPAPARVEPVLAAMVARRLEGRAGLVSAGRYPDAAPAEPPTAAPHGVLHGVAEVLPEVAPWLAEVLGARVHGHLFAPSGAVFCGGGTVFAGGLSAAATLRDHDPAAFLRNLVWATRGEPQVWCLGPRDRPAILAVVARDPHARVQVVTGAWVIGLWRQGAGVDAVRAEAAEVQRLEESVLAQLMVPGRAAQVTVRALGVVLADPSGLLADLAGIVPPGPLAAGDGRLPPGVAVSGDDLGDLAAFVAALRDRGMLPKLVGEIPPPPVAAAAPRRRRAPRVEG